MDINVSVLCVSVNVLARVDLRKGNSSATSKLNDADCDEVGKQPHRYFEIIPVNMPTNLHVKLYSLHMSKTRLETLFYTLNCN